MSRNIDRMKAIVMANARQIIKAKKATTNGRLYMLLFGTGQTTAMRICTEDLGLDPDDNKTDFSEMITFISEMERKDEQKH